MVGFFLGYMSEGSSFSPQLLLLVVLSMVFARSAAMAFNRWLDRDIDAQNPRTIIREIPAGVISANAALWFVIANSIMFITTTYFINGLCFVLSPVALLVILGYSYTKRFTSWCHLVLGLGLGLAPIGSYLAVTGHFDILPILIGFGVMFWVAGFDVIYALQDEEFDKSVSLNSIPVALGRVKSMRLSVLFHLITLVLMSVGVYVAFLRFDSLGIMSMVGLIIFLFLLTYQHLIIKPNDLTRVNMAFFTTNGVASMLFGSLFIIDLIW